MSDYEITMVILKNELIGQPGTEFVPQEECMLTGIKSSAVRIITQMRRKQTIDFCNNWADMGPLIEELSKLGTIVINDGFGLIPQPLAQMICSAGQTLRAAAIVYILVMQECNQ